MNVLNDEIADELARKGSLKHTNNDASFTFSKFASRVKQDTNDFWRVAPVHEW